MFTPKKFKVVIKKLKYPIQVRINHEINQGIIFLFFK